MKKNVIVATLAAAAAMSSVSAFAADAQIQFTGEILTTACTVVGAGQVNNVKMGQVVKTAFSSAGSTAAPTRFYLILSNCPTDLKTASVKFDGTTVAGDSSVLALTSGGATGVGIQLSDATQKVLPLGAASATYPINASGVTTMDFVARYVATTDVANITAGPANAVASFTVNYN